MFEDDKRLQDRVVLSALVRVTPSPHDADSKELGLIGAKGRRRWQLPASVVRALLDVCRVPLAPEHIVEALVAKTGLAAPDVARVIDVLVSGKALVPPTDAQHMAIARLTNDWARRAWHEAMDYHLATYDYPFLDYADAAERKTDVVLMREYAAAEPDFDRAKDVPEGAERVPCPSTADALQRLCVPFAVASERAAGVVDSGALGVIVSASLGVRSRRKTPYGNSAPLLLKTVPSGGARHPTECYVVARGVLGMPDGTYVFACLESALVRLRREHEPPNCGAALQGMEAKASAYIVLCSKTSRNRYRYREPRTFRTVFMDVGHVAANISLAARAMGLEAQFTDDFDAEAFERHLGLDPYEECAVCVAAVTAASAAVDSKGGTP